MPDLTATAAVAARRLGGDPRLQPRRHASAPPIESVLRQTFADFEVLVVDDGSTDGTRAAAEAVADPRVRVIAHDRNRGASAARNTGIREARAAWVAFQDSDDEWLPLKLAKQMARLDAGGFVAAYCGMVVIGSPDDAGRGRPKIPYVPRPDITHVEGDILPSADAHQHRLDPDPGGAPRRARRHRRLRRELPRADRLGADAAAGAARPASPASTSRWCCSASRPTRSPARRRSAPRRAAGRSTSTSPCSPATPTGWRTHYVAAGELRQLGDLAGARAALARARALRPADPRLLGDVRLPAAAQPAPGRQARRGRA